MFKKIMQYLFGSSEKISLSYLKEAGEKTLQGDGKIYGQNGNVIATFEKFTQPVEKVTNGIAKPSSIRSREYVPVEGTKLANMGVKKITTTHTAFGNGLQADVIVNGKKVVKK